jgi:putative phosphoserine phosphatase/1-acylglycerol-3-phosphate O-acyltransferase
VPIVIHNAGDVAPKGDFVFRPATVEVDVLPPVDTSGWRAETIDEHVAEVRRMFQRTLGQDRDWPAPVGEAVPDVEPPAGDAAGPAGSATEIGTKRGPKKTTRKKKPLRKAVAATPAARTVASEKPPRRKPRKNKVGVKKLPATARGPDGRDGGRA